MQEGYCVSPVVAFRCWATELCGLNVPVYEIFRDWKEQTKFLETVIFYKHGLLQLLPKKKLDQVAALLGLVDGAKFWAAQKLKNWQQHAQDACCWMT